MPTLYRRVFIFLSLFIAIGAHAAVTRDATDNALASKQIVVITHLDIARTGLDRALTLFSGYADMSRREAGNLGTQILRQANANNHFTVVEVWKSRSDYDAHISSDATRDFHRQLDPLLGSPHDERLFVSENP